MMAAREDPGVKEKAKTPAKKLQKAASLVKSKGRMSSDTSKRNCHWFTAAAVKEKPARPVSEL